MRLVKEIWVTNSPGAWGSIFPYYSDQVKPLKYYVCWYEKFMSPKFLWLTNVYFIDQESRKLIISHCMTTYFPDNSYFRVTMKLLMAQLHNTDFLKASSVKVQDVMLTSAHPFLEVLKTYKFFLSILCQTLR